MMLRLLTASLCICVMGGCALGPEYERPPVETADSFRMRPGGDGEFSLADLVWWEIFQDEHLQALIRRALLDNKDIRIAVSRVREARARLNATGADQFPQIAGDAGFQRNQTALVRAQQLGIPGNFDREGPTTNQFDSTAGLSFEIDLWGKLRRATEAAQATLLAREWARRTVVLTLISEIAQAYFDLQELDREREIAGRMLQTRQASLDIIRLRTLMGQSSTLNLRRAEQAMARAQAVIPDLERRIGQKENQLSIITGRNPTAIVRGASLQDHPLTPDVPAGLPSALLERRPDILEAEQRLVAANANIGVAQAAFFPAIRLTGNFGAQSLAFSDLFTGPARIWSLGPSITVPIFNAGRNQANLEVSRAQQEQALIAYEHIIQQAFREVEDVLVAHRKIRETRTVRERLADVSQEALQLSHLEYLNGKASYLDVLTAQRETFDADLALVHTQRDQRVAVVQLYKALGGGWHQPRTDEADDSAIREEPQ